MSATIHLGYEVGTGEAVEIPLRHTGVTGQTQQSGKTTTLEGLISRSELRAIAYVTKRGESSFRVMHPIAPYFRERTDWQFVSSLLEATLSERLKFQRSWIMKLCKERDMGKEHWPAPKTLADVLANVEKAIENDCPACHGTGRIADANQGEITIASIQKRAAEYFGISERELKSDSRAPAFAFPRQVAMYVAKQLTPCSLAEIARRFGGLHHTTALHAIQKVEELRSSNEATSRAISELMKEPKTKPCKKCDGAGRIQVARGMNESIFYELREYLMQLVPQIAALPYSNTLDLTSGLNVMDLTAYDFPLQALVVRSAMEWIHRHETATINILPEAWKFTPKQRNTPVRLVAEEFIREGAVRKNFIWLDTQDLAGVADVLVRQIGVWILGVQRAKHEVDRTLDNIPENIHPRPKRSDIMTLGKGQFIACWEGEMRKVYVQPAWMTAAHAEAIARGEEDVDSARDILRTYDKEHRDAKNAGSKTHGDESRGQADRIGRSERTDTRAHRGQDSGDGEHEGDRRTKGSVQTVPAESREDEMKIETLARALRIPNPDKATEDDVVGAIHALVNIHDAVVAREKSSAAAAAAGRSTSETSGGSPSGKGQPSSAAAEHITGNGDWWYPVRALHTDEQVGRLRLNDFVELIGPEMCKYIRTNGPRILELIESSPELRVKVERPVLELDGSSLNGRLARLLSEKFFDQTKSAGDVLREGLRRGWFSSGYRTNLLQKPLKDLAEKGFLTIEGDGYQAVPGMRVTVKEQP